MAVTLTGTTGNDTLFGSTAQATLINALDGNDRLEGQYTNATLNGAKGNDSINIIGGNGGEFVINPGKGDDVIGISGLTSLGTLNIAVEGNNAGDDLFQFGTALGPVSVGGTINGGDGKDSIVFADGNDFGNAYINLNSGVDQFNISATSAATFGVGSVGLGQGNDSATIVSTTSVAWNNATLNGGKGADTFQIDFNTSTEFSGFEVNLGGGSDVLSAVIGGTGASSGGQIYRGDSGADSLTFTLTAVTTAGGNYSFSVFGDTEAADSAAFGDIITVDFNISAVDITGTIAGGGGADTILLTGSLIETGDIKLSVDGGFGADVIKVDGNQFIGTINGGGGNDSLVIDQGIDSGRDTNSGAGANTLIGGAGTDTFANTSLGTSVTLVTAFEVVELEVAIADMGTADIIKLEGQKVVNADANIASLSTFYTGAFSSYTGFASGGTAANNIALYRDGDDIILEIGAGTGLMSTVSDGQTGSSVGMGVIRFVDNSTFAKKVQDASGQITALNGSFSFTQGLSGATVEFN